jgi:hypothetical protein
MKNFINEFRKKFILGNNAYISNLVKDNVLDIY